MSDSFVNNKGRLEERVNLFNKMALPGQPLGMHMGTSYLVNDLMREIQELREALKPSSKLDNLTDAIVEDILNETDEDILSEHSPKQIEDWKVRAKGLSDAAWNAVNEANDGARFVDNTTTNGRLSEIALELATHLGAAGRLIDKLKAELAAERRGLRAKLEGSGA